MLAHLLLLRCNGGLEAATALPDTFGTQAFVAAAVATTVPDEFVADVQERHDSGRQIKLGEISSFGYTQKTGNWLDVQANSMRTSGQPQCSLLAETPYRGKQ